MSHNQREIFDIVSFKASKTATQAYSTSFSAGIRLLHQRFQNAIYGVYGFVRYADEIVDTLHEFNKEELMQNFRRDTIHAIEHKVSLNPILHAFQMVYHRYNFDFELVDRFLISMEMDLQQKEYDRAGYEAYILGSAEVVGLMCLKVFTEGNDEQYQKLTPFAMRLGAAFQKINFLRDMKDDFNGLGRAYFPGLDFQRFDDEMKARIEEEIAEDFDAAYKGILMLPKDARLGVLIAYVYYKRLFSKIRSIPSHRIMEERIRIPNSSKYALLMSCYIKNNLNLI
jgi:phytoene/squalene synthetase